MEASKFGFGPDTPPAFKFDPTDDDIVAYYLLPRALGLPNPYAHAVIEDDPGSVPPWELLRKHGGDGKIDHAFFFGPPTDAAQNGRRKSRTIKGAGVWQGQKGQEGTVTLLHPGGGGELDVTYKRYNLTFCRTKGGASTGYIMHEYEIISPPLPGTVLSRVKINKHPKKGTAAADEQPGTSYQDDAPAMPSDSKGFSFGDPQAGALCGGNPGGMSDPGCYYTRLKCAFPENYFLPVTDQAAANDDAAAMKSDSQGFTGAQADALSGGGMVETTDGAYYDPSQFVPVTSGAYNNYHGQFQEIAPWPYQPGQSHYHSQYLVGDAAVMPSHGEGFAVEQQAGALCGHAEDSSLMCSGSEQQAGALSGYSDNGSVCHGGEEDAEEINDVLFGDHDGDFNCEMSNDEIYDVLFGDNDGYFNREQS